MGKGLTRLPAETPRTPGPKGVNFQQFCDQLRTDLPGDSQGRRSFDTRTRFVAGDPGARFGSAAPLEARTLVKEGIEQSGKTSFLPTVLSGVAR